MAAMLFLWSTRHWDGHMDWLLIICKHSDDPQDYDVISENNSLFFFVQGVYQKYLKWTIKFLSIQWLIFLRLVFYRTDRLYWVDAQLLLVGHIHIHGHDRQTLSNIGQITQPFSLTVYAGEFFGVFSCPLTFSCTPILCTIRAIFLKCTKHY